jgi:hypothetical protein
MLKGTELIKHKASPTIYAKGQGSTIIFENESHYF